MNISVNSFNISFQGVKSEKTIVSNEIVDPQLQEKGYYKGKILQQTDEVQMSEREDAAVCKRIYDGMKVNRACDYALLKREGIDSVDLSEADVFEPNGKIKEVFLSKPVSVPVADDNTYSVEINNDGGISYKELKYSSPDGRVAFKNIVEKRLSKDDISKWPGIIRFSIIVEGDKYKKMIQQIATAIANNDLRNLAKSQKG